MTLWFAAAAGASARIVSPRTANAAAVLRRPLFISIVLSR